jgi:hypothetical protein
MQYSDKELSNLRSITEKKLGQKISQDYLLLSTSVKAAFHSRVYLGIKVVI